MNRARPPWRVACLVGTRPEAVKMAPVVRALRARPEVATTVVASGQHRDLVAPTLAEFGLGVDVDLAVMRPRQELAGLTARLLTRLDRWLAAGPPDLVIGQGDTTTVLATALAAFYRRIPFAHVEAGLRSFDAEQPFPEEINRSLVAHLARLHFAPLATHRRNLVREGIPPERIHVTGNPVVDAVRSLSGRPTRLPFEPPPGARLLLLTAHRRESHGAPLAEVGRAVRELLDGDPSLFLVAPLHPNPAAATLGRALAGHPRANLVPPLGYAELVATLARATLVLTDSGGLQEEAPALGVPLLVLRERTERPEVVEAGAARLVGTDGGRLLAAAREILGNETTRRRMTRARSLYGDGRSGPRIARHVVAFLRRRAAERGGDGS